MKWLIYCIMLISISSCGNVKPITDVTTILPTPGTKVELYDKAILWFAKTFNDSKSVLEIKDRDNGTLLGKGNISIDGPGIALASYSLHFTISVDFKDNKTRLMYSGFDVIAQGMNVTGQYSQEKIETRLKILTSNLSNYLVVEKDTNW